MDTSGYDTLKADVSKLLADIGSMASAASGNAKAKFEESRIALQQKLAEADAKSAELRAAGEAAGDELKHGFSRAADDLKNALTAAREHLSS